MSQIISVASGFQYSVNIGYDLNNDDKLKNFIPTKSALELLEDILSSTSVESTDRARVLIGAYGKGKSHIVLMILSILMRRNIALLEKVVPQLENNPRLKQLVENYYESSNKILPVVITGSNTSLSQAFLIALQRTLSDNNLLDVMPETNYKAAVAVIKRWEAEFPTTYTQLEELLDEPVSVFVEKLGNYNIAAYEQFEKLYPALTAGSVFNPFLGFDVVELYEQAANGLKKKGYTGIYVIYDEFSKYLEANIVAASLSDTKMLQDFAEKCNRSGSLQMHLMLICHKEISNYIDKLPKQKVDGWRGVSERFKHVRFHNNFSQTYEIISSVITKKEPEWSQFKNKYQAEFLATKLRYEKHPIFSDVSEDLDISVWDCYPLSPVSTFILPRLSEKVAQNERTLFTFLSAEGSSTLSAFIDNSEEDEYKLITPDVIYDYFEPLLKKESYGSTIHGFYTLTGNILSKLSSNSLEAKIVKTISLIYILEQFERLEPTREEVVNAFSSAYSVEQIDAAITELVAKQYVVYLKRSNNYLRLKQSSGVDIGQQISDTISLSGSKTSISNTLNAVNVDRYLYPARYNDEREITRYFAFDFVDDAFAVESTDWGAYLEKQNSDGVICAVLMPSNESIESVKKRVISISECCPQIIFVVPKQYKEITGIIQEYNAVCQLREKAIDDPVLFDEYDVIYEDLKEIIGEFIASYTHPEKYSAWYIHMGAVQGVRRKAALTELMSKISDEVFCCTPVVNNEAVNKNEITTVAANSRNKIVAALLRTDLEKGLGLSGSGQEVSIMRSTLVRTGIWREDPIPEINLTPEDADISNLLKTIEDFIVQSRRETVSFSVLYEILTGAKHHIGIRKGLIPIYLAAVLHQYKQQIVISDRFGQVLLNADTLSQINADPGAFLLSYMEWDPEKEAYINKLSNLFSDYVVEAEMVTNSYDFVANAMKRWFLSLPKYAKEAKVTPDGEKIDKRYSTMAKLFRSNPSSYELLFKLLPRAFGYGEECNCGIAENIEAAKRFYDCLIDNLKKCLISRVKDEFILAANKSRVHQMSLASVINDWCETLDPKVFEQLFTDGTNRCLELFKSVTNDEDSFIVRLAKLGTDLRIEDWDDATSDRFYSNLRKYRKTAVEYVSNEPHSDIDGTSNYQITFVDENGQSVTKRFDKVESSKRGKLLYNQITASLDAMGHAISEQEKRQILMEILKKLC